jgi:DNA-binding transcriptional regulator YhcF (GntR family)
MAQQISRHPEARPDRSLIVDRDGELPVGLQLAWRLRAMIAAGRLQPGERLPSVRELSERAGVHVNTVRSVYGQLEDDGLVASRQGVGTFVSGRALDAAELDRIAAAAVEEARELGLDPRRLAAAVYGAAVLGGEDEGDRLSSVTSTPLPDPGYEGDPRAVRGDLRRQIERLEAELAAYARDVPQPEPVHPLALPDAHVADVGELEEVRNRLLQQLADARSKAARRGRREQRARVQREAMVRDPEGHRWQWVSNEDAGERTCGKWQVTPRYGPLGALMGWWRVKVSSGCPLAGAG